MNDPLFGIALTRWYWLAGGLASGTGAWGSLAHNTKWPIGFVVLLTAGFLGVRFCAVVAGLSADWGGYLAPLGGVFGWRGATADLVLLSASCVFLAAGFAAVWRERQSGKRNREGRT